MAVTTVIEAPAPFVTLEEAKAHLRVDGNDSDDLIQVLMGAACGLIDGPQGWIGRAVGEQTLEIRLDEFPDEPICLPCSPVIEVESVKYIDTDGVEQTVDDETYRLTGVGTLNVQIELVDGESWPAAKEESEAVRIQYTAGYETVPPGLKAAALLMLGDLYENRETVVVGAQVAAVAMTPTVDRLIAPYRVISI